MRYVVKTLITAVIITAVSETGKRSTWAAAVLASLPLTSILAMIWLFRDTGDAAKVSQLSYGILLALVPSVIFFLALPFLLRHGHRFSVSLVFSCALMCAAYWSYIWMLRKIGVQI